MLGLTQVIVIDDKPEELTTLVTALSNAGVSCRGILYDGQEVPNTPCSHVRVVFMDVNLLNNTLQSDFHGNFGAIGELLEQLSPKGPYLLVLWTAHADQAEELETFLNDRLSGVCKPFAVMPLAKADFMTEGNFDGVLELATQVKSLMQSSPALTALFDWEEQALAAVASTSSAVTMIGNTTKTGREQQQEIPNLLTRMAIDVAGPNHYRNYPFQAINEVLVPILSDLITSEGIKDQRSNLWTPVFDQAGKQPKISLERAAELNRNIHIDQPSRNSETASIEPGTVLTISHQHFGDFLGNLTELPQQELAQQLRCKRSAAENKNYRWVLVQTQPPCDYAWSNPGFLPFHLGIEAQANDIRDNGLPAHLWLSPPFLADSQVKRLAVSARFPVSLSRERSLQAETAYRLRTQLLVELLHRMHSHNSRPGIITITEGPKK